MITLRSNLQALGVPLRGDERRPELGQLLLTYILDTPGLFPEQPGVGAGVLAPPGERPNKLHRGLRLPPAMFLRRSLNGGTPAGAASAAATASARRRAPDPLRDRHDYAHLVDADDVARMLVAAHAERVAVIHLGGACSWADSFVIATGRSAPHLNALAGAVLHQLQSALEAARAAREGGGAGAAAPGVRPSIEGRTSMETPEWLLVDMGSTVVHLFTAEFRREYDLESLWGESRGCVVRYMERDEVVPPARGAVPHAEPPAVFGAAQRAALAAARLAALARVDPGAAASAVAERGAAQQLEPLAASESMSAEEAAKQMSALARYEEARAVDGVREARRQAREEERAAAVVARQRAADAAGAAQRKDRRLAPLPPPAAVQRGLVAAALAHGLDFGGSLPRHHRDCACAACGPARESLAAAYPEAAAAAALVPPPAPPACEPGCGCSRCMWIRWRSAAPVRRSAVMAAAAGVPALRVGASARADAVAAAAAAAAEAEEAPTEGQQGVGV
jgi:ribosomal silencing factor RsfS